MSKIKASKILNEITQGSFNGDLSLDSLRTIETVVQGEIKRREVTAK